MRHAFIGQGGRCRLVLLFRSALAFRRGAASAKDAGQGLPFAPKLLPGLTFDMRAALAIHERGIRQAVEASGGGLSPRTAAFTLSAELFLM